MFNPKAVHKAQVPNPAAANATDYSHQSVHPAVHKPQGNQQQQQKLNLIHQKKVSCKTNTTVEYFTLENYI